MLHELEQNVEKEIASLKETVQNKDSELQKVGLQLVFLDRCHCDIVEYITFMYSRRAPLKNKSLSSKGARVSAEKSRTTINSVPIILVETKP